MVGKSCSFVHRKCHFLRTNEQDLHNFRGSRHPTPWWMSRSINTQRIVDYVLLAGCDPTTQKYRFLTVRDIHVGKISRIETSKTVVDVSINQTMSTWISRVGVVHLPLQPFHHHNYCMSVSYSPKISFHREIHANQHLTQSYTMNSKKTRRRYTSGLHQIFILFYSLHSNTYFLYLHDFVIRFLHHFTGLQTSITILFYSSFPFLLFHFHTHL